MLFSVLKHFWENSLKNSLLSKKNISEKSSEIVRKFFSQQVWKGANPEEN